VDVYSIPAAAYFTCHSALRLYAMRCVTGRAAVTDVPVSATFVIKRIKATVAARVRLSEATPIETVMVQNGDRQT